MLRKMSFVNLTPYSFLVGHHVGVNRERAGKAALVETFSSSRQDQYFYWESHGV